MWTFFGPWRPGTTDTLTILTPPGVTTTVGDITVHGSLKLFNAKTTNLQGHMLVEQTIHSLEFADSSNSSLNILGQSTSPVTISFAEVTDLKITSAEPV